jgi:hypothetical protein
VGFTIGSRGKVPGKTCEKRRKINNNNNNNGNCKYSSVERQKTPILGNAHFMRKLIVAHDFKYVFSGNYRAVSIGDEV